MLEGDTTPDMLVEPSDGLSPSTDGAQTDAPVTVRRRSIFQDPVVRTMGLAAVGLIVVYLLVIIGALLTGVLGQGRPIQTAAERDLRLYEQMIRQGSRNEQVWGFYVNALIRTQQYGKAQQVIDRGKKGGVVDPRARHLDLAQVKLALARKDYKRVITAADSGMAALEKQSKADWAEYRKSGSPTVMTATGLGNNYYDMLYAKAQALDALKQPKKAIEVLKEYLEEKETAADVLEWRGDLYVKAGDKKKAAADYKSARIYMDDTKAIDAKIKKLGVDK